MAILESAVLGSAEVVTNIRRKQDSMGKQCERGLTMAGLHLLRTSQKLVPVEFGPLKASGFIRKTGSGWGTAINVGYTAAYAIYVHENLEMKLKGQPRTPNPPHKGRYWDPQGRGQSKFLEQPMRTEAKEMRKMINDAITIL